MRSKLIIYSHIFAFITCSKPVFIHFFGFYAFFMHEYLFFIRSPKTNMHVNIKCAPLIFKVRIPIMDSHCNIYIVFSFFFTHSLKRIQKLTEMVIKKRMLPPYKNERVILFLLAANLSDRLCSIWLIINSRTCDKYSCSSILTQACRLNIYPTINFNINMR